MRIFCVVYRPQSHRMKYFLRDFEDLLQFSRTLKYDSILFDDFNNDTIKESKDQSDYENLITAYCVRRQNSEPTRVTPTSSTCLDHLLTGLPIKAKQLKQHSYTAVGEIHIDTTCFREKQHFFFKTRNPKKIKRDKAVNFLFLLDQNLIKLEEEKLTIDIISRTILDCVDRFAPKRYALHKISPSNDWIKKASKTR